ncbi:hypothetical protein IEQ34_019672 [Dendrobium chrysotoxum]|uniref:Uncharacterized protein n=1 Tax=Dendrobium chrysotoxum TaxID=161865 RepID=A0AAV7GAL0_DENCH|nr:hypothetical protein IEQ34_019672 [Dendrobium chrysotoxum]
MFAHNLFFFIMAMVIAKDEGRTGGKICKQPLRRVPFTPYNRPRSAVRGICRPPPVDEAGRSGWFAKKLFDSAARLVVKSVSRLFSVFVKDIAATPAVLLCAGENSGAMEEVSEVPTDPCPIPSSSFVQPTDPSPISSSSFESSQIVKAAEKQKSSYEVREQGGNSLDIRLSIPYDGSDTSRQELISHVHDIFQLEEQLNQKKFSRKVFLNL